MTKPGEFGLSGTNQTDIHWFCH